MKIKFFVIGSLFMSTLSLAAMTDDQICTEMFPGSGRDEKTQQQKQECRRQSRALVLITQLADSYEKTVVSAAQEVQTSEMREEYVDQQEQAEYVLDTVISEAEELVEQLNRLFLEMENSTFAAAVKKLHMLSQECFFERSTKEPYFLKYRQYCVGGAVKAIRTLGTQLKLGAEELRK